MPDFPTALIMTALQCLIVLGPICGYAVIKRSIPVLSACLMSLGICIMQAAILFAPSPGWLSTLQYNWLQKALVFAVTVIACKLLVASWRDSGLGLPKRGIAFAIAILLGFVLAIPELYQIFQNPGAPMPSDEALLFELTMPGLQEEPVYRGLLLLIWDRTLGTPWRFCGVKFGPGCLITTALFVVGHTVALSEDWHLVTEQQPLVWLDFIVFSLAMCWLRYSFSSFWPAVIAHNTVNELSVLCSRFFGPVTEA